MAIESVSQAAPTKEAIADIYRDLCGIVSLAQILQEASQNIAYAKSGLYGTASVIEDIAERAIKKTGM
ncbi:hypothetical protein LYSHEL_25440 [Lysobacter helvus]|uniref:Uncharacterized protein n=2 Tax=Lysobacteraceae TaxID=32033 RepID=A0ABM7Q7X2_9GAMM|nr:MULTISPECIES: hypothetical protein [Lysobacter]BCT93520.1 hypothetical protein LYSCAS_25440 [Lysobacter caseinilyticus]BCT96673.1 hypothetical protein LYSHEL_25440 [Lysobacter helvus]